jgi:hypothetical protein
MNKIVSCLAALAVGVALLGVPASASATTSWGTLTAPGTTGLFTDPGSGSNFVTFYGEIASNSSTASTIVTNFQGQFSTAVYVECKNGALNSNFASNSSVVVACPFFASTVSEATGTGSSS